MKVDINGKKYEIRWGYVYSMTKGTDTEKPRRRRNRPPHTTICSMHVGEKGDELCKVQIRLLRGDTPCYETARKVSLKKLLAAVVPDKKNIDFRAKVWQTYLNRPRPKTVKKEVVLQQPSAHVMH